MAGLDFLIAGNRHELSIKEIANLYTDEWKFQKKIIDSIILLCESGKLEYYGDLKGWRRTKANNPYPKVTGYDFGQVPFMGEGESFFSCHAQQCLIHRDNFKSYLKSVNQWPIKDCKLAGWWGDDEITTGALLPHAHDWKNDSTLTKLDKQHFAILEVIGIKKFEPMKIPDGEKGTIKMICVQDYPGLFDGDSSFDNAWKQGKTKFRMANHAS